MGNHKNHSKQKAELKKYFPNIIGFIDAFKKEFGYEQFSIALQQIEAVLFIDTILPAVQQKYSCLPKHDSIIVNKKDVPEVMEILKTIFDAINFKYQFKIDGEIRLNAEPQQELIKETIKHSTGKAAPVNRQEIKKRVERFITEEAKDEGIQELEYFEKYWPEKYGLQTAYEMNEGQFVKLEKKGIHLRPKNLLKAV